MRTEWMPERGSLVAECVRVMRMRIASGEWAEHLPGERRLSEILQVGRDTVRLTLAELETSGWILPAETGKRRGIATGRPDVKPARRSLKIGLLSPRRLERLSQPVLLEVDHLREMLGEKGMHLEVHAPSWYEKGQPEARLDEFVATEGCAAWILFRSSRAVLQWFAGRRIPCLVRGHPPEGIELPFLDVDWEAVARHAAGMLWRLGHRRIGVVVPPDRLRGVEAAIRGATSLGESGFEARELHEDGTVAGVQRMFQRALIPRDAPTALISTRARQIVTLTGCAARRGLRVPEDLSLLTLAREPFLEFFVPEITGYRIDPQAVARQVSRRLEQILAGNPHPGSNPWITPKVVRGGSVAGPPQC